MRTKYLMKAYKKVNRKELIENRIAICPKFGCEYVKRVKPLVFGLFGLKKYPKCKKHGLSMIYIEDRIGDLVDGAISCLFDIGGLPPKKLLIQVKKQCPTTFQSFIYGWLYCLTTGRGAQIISRYMDSVSNAFLKQLTRKQVKIINENKDHHTIYQALQDAMIEISNQYVRLIRHLKTHSEVFNDTSLVKPFPKKLKEVLKTWLKESLLKEENKNQTILKSLSEMKEYYDDYLNLGTCRALLGLFQKEHKITKNSISTFDIFAVYFDFMQAGLTKKFTKKDVENLFNLETPYLIEEKEGENYGLLYVILETKTNMVYVGQTIRDIFTRFAEHLRNPPNQYFRSAVKYYLDRKIELRVIKSNDREARTENGEFVISLVSCAKYQDELNQLEIDEIKKRKSCVLDYFTIENNKIIPLFGYNISRGGACSRLTFNEQSDMNYDYITEKELKKLIIRGLFISEVKKEFNAPELIIYSKIQEFWSEIGIYSIDDARKKFGGIDKYNFRVRHFALSEDYKKFDKKLLSEFKNLILKGLSTSEIKIEMNLDHSVIYEMLNVLGFDSFTSARDILGINELYNERMKENHLKSVKRRNTHSQWIDVNKEKFIELIKKHMHYSEMATQLHIAERTLYDKSYEIFGLSLTEADRIYRLYPQVEKTLINRIQISEPFLNDWIKSGLNINEIDQEILKLLISIGYDKKDIELIFEWDHFHVTRWIPEVLDMNFYRARDEYWWKPRIISLFRRGYSARKMREVSKEIIGRYVTHNNIIRIWKEEYKKYGKNLLQYLYQEYGPQKAI